MDCRRVFLWFCSLMILSGCASYAAPGGRADLRAVGAPEASALGPGTNGEIRQSFQKQPLASFPASVAVVRVQDRGYHSRTATGWGRGAIAS